ncbi:MAG TPA: DNA ligase D [Flavipsychrobacter sp.]
MLAKISDEPFDSKDWIFEIKWDGYRAIAEIAGSKTKLYSRNGLSFENKYPEIYQALTTIKANIVVDGEIVVLDKEGKPGFQLLQQYNPGSGELITYYVFDVLLVNGESVQHKTQLERKALLKELLPDNDWVKYCDHIDSKGTKFFSQAQKLGLEGIIAKKKQASYEEGRRTGNWLKIRNVLMEEAVIAGFTAPRKSRKYFGALVLGIYKKGKLTYIGHTGTGFNDKSLKELHTRMSKLVTDVNPFSGPVKVNAAVTWLKPELVCNIKYTEITGEGIRRHPVFLGLREDKEAEEVTGDIPADTTEVRTNNNMKKGTIRTKASLTNLDKIYWPDEGFTKGDVLNYYNSVYKYIIRHLKGRPQSLKRTPNGIKGKSFFHKDAGENAPDFVDTYPVYSDSADKTIDYLVCNNKDTLLYIANLGCIEMNPWNSRVSQPDKPDYVVLDLDPSDKNTFDEVVECALVMNEILTRAGCPSFCKTSGSTGLHIYIPLNAKYTYEQARAFAQIVASITQERLPGTTTLERSLSKRKKNHIYLDYLQNKEGATLSCPYSLRPKPGAPVSMPLDWKEVKPGLSPTDFNIKNALSRIEKKGDIFLPVLKKGIDMQAVLGALSD